MITSLLLSFLMLVPPEEPKMGPAAGALVIDGGGEGAGTIKTFVALAGGQNSPVVLIPTASEGDHLDSKSRETIFCRAGCGYGRSPFCIPETGPRPIASHSSRRSRRQKACGSAAEDSGDWSTPTWARRLPREIEAVLRAAA